MFDNYMDVIYKGGYDHPIRITFEKAYIVLTGEGGNRHLIIGDNEGSIDLWVDTHTYGKYVAFLNTTRINQNPSGKLVYKVWKLIDHTTANGFITRFWTKDSLNEFFRDIYDAARKGFLF